MSRKTAPAYALALVLLDAAAAWCHDPTSLGNLPSRTGFVRFDILQGRLTASCAGQTASRSAAAEHPSGWPKEKLTASGPCDKPSVRYEFFDENQELILDIVCGENIKLSCERRAASKAVRVTFEQSNGKEATLAIADDAGVRRYTAPGLWHLLLTQPDECRAHLLPALARLRSDWVFEERVARLEAALVELSHSGAFEKRRRCALLVDQLSHANYQLRQAADMELRGLGQIAVVFLSRLNVSRLDAEQRQRVRRIRDDLSTSTCDTPERVAAWMLSDRTVWFTLLAHEKPEYRHAAALQLSRICDRQIEFDPAAAAIERQAQIERLRERLAKGL